MNDGIIVNKVATSNLVTIDLEKIIGDFEVVPFDIKDLLFMELMLKEKDFREQLAVIEEDRFNDKVVAVYCSTDAILAPWAFALVTARISPFARCIYYAEPETVAGLYASDQLIKHDWEQYSDRRVILKGCSDKSIPSTAYAFATNMLTRYADRIMYGEACSFVPIWRK